MDAIARNGALAAAAAEVVVVVEEAVAVLRTDVEAVVVGIDQCGWTNMALRRVLTIVSSSRTSPAV